MNILLYMCESFSRKIYIKENFWSMAYVATFNQTDVK